MEKYKKQNIFLVWFNWHFYEMPKFLLGVWKNYIFFALNYFSLPILIKSLFSPWRRYRWNYPKAFDVGEFFSAFISNSFSRFIGFLMRVILIIVAIPFQVLVVITGLIVFIFWLFLPFIIVFGLLFAFFY